MPITRQAANWTCGPNAIQKVCANYGGDYREMDLVHQLGIAVYGKKPKFELEKIEEIR